MAFLRELRCMFFHWRYHSLSFEEGFGRDDYTVVRHCSKCDPDAARGEKA